ncbi:MAG: ATP-binding cassette domain-containing protein [Alphaproteobacteria bacterium]
MAAGEIVALLGSNGAGKSTLNNTISPAAMARSMPWRTSTAPYPARSAAISSMADLKHGRSQAWAAAPAPR